MNNADLVWRLVELLLQKEKDLCQTPVTQVSNNNNQIASKHDEA